jgi:hypothetical protein
MKTSDSELPMGPPAQSDHTQSGYTAPTKLTYTPSGFGLLATVASNLRGELER